MTGTFHFIEQELTGIFPPDEIRSLIRILTEHICGIPYHFLLLDKGKQLSEKEKKEFIRITRRLKQAEPIQYILGEAAFYDLTFKVTPDVLIPRPETEELIDRIIRRHAKKELRIADIGTGSGCIAVTLARHLPDAEIWAVDISEAALAVARENAIKNEAGIHFVQTDILSPDAYAALPGSFDIIVSNPPYVTHSEKEVMEKNVLEYEPAAALFVPDHEPLLFYRAIARFGKQKIRENGFLYFEINARFGKETAGMLQKEGYRNIRLYKDISGKDRITEAQL